MSLLARAAGVSPFGPIFGKELRVTSRRKRSYLLRVGYLGLLLVALLFAYATTGRSGGGVAAQAQRQQELGFAFFMAFTVFCVGSMGLIGPVLTANAIGAEKLAKTLPVLLMTPITAWQIVSGKLLSRVLTALTLLGLSLPVLALVRLLGGVEVEQMAVVLAIAVSHVIACAAIGLFYSLFITRPAVVILLSYATLGVLYVLLPFVLVLLFEVGQGGPASMQSGIRLVAAIHPFGCAIWTAVPQMRGFIGDTWVVTVLVQLGLAAGLVGWTALLLRRQFRDGGERGGGPVALPPPVASPPVASPPVLPPPSLVGPSSPVLPPPLPTGTHAGGVGVSAPRLVAPGPPPLSYASAGMRARDVSDNPVLWREIRRPMFVRTWQRVVGVCVVLGILGLVYRMLGTEDALDETDAQSGFAVVMHGLWWLVAAVLSATAIAQEKESDTWTLLLTTPLSGAQVVWGKAAGLLRRMLWPTVLMAAHFLLFAIAGVVPFWSVLFVLWMVLACNSTWVATGVYLSLRLKKVTFAVIANLLLAVGLYAVVPLAVLIPAELLTRDGGEVAQHTFWYLPYYYLGAGFEGMDRSMNRREVYDSSGFPYDDVYSLPGAGPRVSAATFVGFGVACGLAHLLAAYLVLQRTAANFDVIVGRAGRGRFIGLTDTDGSVLTDAETIGAGDRDGPVAPPGGPAAAAVAGRDTYASVPRRLAAFLIDTMIVQCTCGLVGLAWGVVAIVSEAADRDLDGGYYVERALLGHLQAGMWAGVVVGWLYAAGFEASRRRATPGKMLVGVFVTDAAGRRASFLRASARYGAKVVGGLPLMAGYLVALVTRRRQALHDLLAGTLVLRK